MTDSQEIGDRLREVRRRRGMTQEELAKASNLSLQVVKKIEQGGSARLETLHQLARTLGVVTLTFVGPTSPEPMEDNHDDVVLADMRSVINPPMGLSGRPIYGTADSDNLDLSRLSAAVKVVAGAYHADRYDDLASFLPALVRSAHHHVDGYADSQERHEALRLRADVVGLAGRYLIQIRAHDLALMALHASLMDALEIGDTALAAAAVSGQAHAMLRQGRLAEVERLCRETAEQIEPQLSKATPNQLAAWGWMLLRASAAAARNNRPQEAQEYHGMAAAAAAPLQREHHTVDYKTFGPVTVALKAVENALVAGDPVRALELSAPLRRGDDMTSEEWDRHLLDEARAHVQTGGVDSATEILLELRGRSPRWLRYQQLGRDTLRDVLVARTRTLSEEQRALADFMGIRE
ncbi:MULTISPECIES: helix-turn-helix domain-containing protein [Streptosporangium]|uniref:Transcriptional regulator with XRE-family HTH domain n=1 Tax=Streptosporangium brasiliense TaxID=47480 RepID=A0ABT9RAU3_9ACTN|nr:helix-turn-helix transcriptional regulator [Streptosporangium brasiliense]MDP9866353.1 transcriptional regulator with XRE-family HTH domain [Streptosporangium brasiliense]